MGEVNYAGAIVNKMNVLITGGAGFIGSHLAEILYQAGVTVRVVDDLSTGSLDNLAALRGRRRFSFVQDDVRSLGPGSAVFEGIDAIIHLAALVSVQRANEAPRESFSRNAEGTFNIFEAARQIPTVRGVVFASSAAVYGNPDRVPVKEEDSVAPRSLYGADKLYGESLASAYAAVHRVSSRVLRLFNVYGPRQRGDSPYSGVISVFGSTLVKQSEPCRIDGDGKQTRDFIYVKDVAHAFHAAVVEVLSAEQGSSFTANIGTGIGTSIESLYRKIAAIVGETYPPARSASRSGDIHDSCADVSRAERLLQWRAKTDLAEGLRSTVGWMRRDA